MDTKQAAEKDVENYEVWSSKGYGFNPYINQIREARWLLALLDRIEALEAENARHVEELRRVVTETGNDLECWPSAALCVRSKMLELDEYQAKRERTNQDTEDAARWRQHIATTVNEDGVKRPMPSLTQLGLFSRETSPHEPGD